MLKLTKKILNQHLVPHLSKGKRGPECKVGLWRIVRSIAHRVKTGTQWRESPVRRWFEKNTLTWNTVYYYYNKWCKDGSWQRLWEALLELNKAELDMSSVQLDGSHTPAWRGGEAVAYQAGRPVAQKEAQDDQHALSDRQPGHPAGLLRASGGQPQRPVRG